MAVLVNAFIILNWFILFNVSDDFIFRVYFTILINMCAYLRSTPKDKVANAGIPWCSIQIQGRLQASYPAFLYWETVWLFIYLTKYIKYYVNG